MSEIFENFYEGLHEISQTKFSVAAISRRIGEVNSTLNTLTDLNFHEGTDDEAFVPALEYMREGLGAIDPNEVNGRNRFEMRRLLINAAGTAVVNIEIVQERIDENPLYPLFQNLRDEQANLIAQIINPNGNEAIADDLVNRPIRINKGLEITDESMISDKRVKQLVEAIRVDKDDTHGEALKRLNTIERVRGTFAYLRRSLSNLDRNYYPVTERDILFDQDTRRMIQQTDLDKSSILFQDIYEIDEEIVKHAGKLLGIEDPTELLQKFEDAKAYRGPRDGISEIATGIEGLTIIFKSQEITKPILPRIELRIKGDAAKKVLLAPSNYGTSTVNVLDHLQKVRNQRRNLS